jgi:hypothetical protein
MEAYANGQAVPVFYDPEYPYTNSLVPFSTSWFPELAVAAVAGRVAVGGVIYGLVVWRRTPIRP